MVEVELRGIKLPTQRKELFAKEFGTEHTRWFGLVALDLWDKREQQNIAEWFYLVVCSKEYKENPFHNGPDLNDKYVIVQDAFNLDDVRQEAVRRMDGIHAQDWEQFYQQMEELFLHED